MLGSEFASCWDKIGRADHHIKTVESELMSWVESDLYTSSKEKNLDGSRHAIVVHGKNKPPVERYALITGDAIHNLRSALDHMLFAALSSERTQPFTADEERAIQFPIVIPPRSFDESVKRWVNFTRNRDLVDAVKAVQPENRRHADVPPLLELLAYFDNRDKHRLLNVILANVSEGQFSFLTYPSDPPSRIDFGYYDGSIEDGKEIAWFTIDPPQPDIRYSHEAAIVVSICHPIGPSGRNYTELIAMLKWLIDEVTFVVNRVGSVVG